MRNKITFFILGSILSLIAYHIGHSDKVKADTPTIFEDVWIKGKLTVSGGQILLNNTNSVHTKDETKGPKSYIYLIVDENNCVINMTTNETENIKPADSNLLLVTRNVKNNSVASITLSGYNDQDRWHLRSSEPK